MRRADTGGAGGAEGRRGAGAGAGVAEPSADDAVYESLVERERSQGNEIAAQARARELRRKLAAAEAAAAAANAATAARAPRARPGGRAALRLGGCGSTRTTTMLTRPRSTTRRSARSAAAPKPVEVLTLPKTQDLVGEILEKKVIADLLDEGRATRCRGRQLLQESLRGTRR